MVNGWGQLWTIIYIVIFVNTASEFERSMRISFLRSFETKESEKRKIEALQKEQQLQLEQQLASKKYEMDLLDLAASQKKALADAEKQALRCLIGNVAHDLKTHFIASPLTLRCLSLFL